MESSDTFSEFDGVAIGQGVRTGEKAEVLDLLTGREMDEEWRMYGRIRCCHAIRDLSGFTAWRAAARTLIASGQSFYIPGDVTVTVLSCPSPNSISSGSTKILRAMMSSKTAMHSIQRSAAHAFRSTVPGLPGARVFRLRTTSPPLLRNTNISTSNSRILDAIRRRHLSTGDRPLTDRAQEQSEQDLSDADAIAMRKAISPAYQLWFTCKQCLERSGHTVSKQAYHFGTCVISCPKCKGQHLISDHLKIFSDTSLTLEDIAKEHGQIMRKGRLGADGNIEFYTDDATDKVS